MFQLFSKLQALYDDDIHNLDVYPAGVLEGTSRGPGELFKAAILDQFIRLRNGDRYWFENINKGYNST